RTSAAVSSTSTWGLGRIDSTRFVTRAASQERGFLTRGQRTEGQKGKTVRPPSVLRSFDLRFLAQQPYGQQPVGADARSRFRVEKALATGGLGREAARQERRPSPRLKQLVDRFDAVVDEPDRAALWAG